MSVRTGLAVLLGFVACTTLTYAVCLNGYFTNDDLVPAWAIAVSAVLTAAIVAGVLWWLCRVSAWAAPTHAYDDFRLYVLVSAISGLSQALGIVGEIVLKIPGLWSVIPTAAFGYGAFIVWFQQRYGSPPTIDGEP